AREKPPLPLLVSPRGAIHAARPIAPAGSEPERRAAPPSGLPAGPGRPPRAHAGRPPPRAPRDPASARGDDPGSRWPDARDVPARAVPRGPDRGAVPGDRQPRGEDLRARLDA